MIKNYCGPAASALKLFGVKKVELKLYKTFHKEVELKRYVYLHKTSGQPNLEG